MRDARVLLAFLLAVGFSKCLFSPSLSGRESKIGLFGSCLMEKDIRTLLADQMFIFRSVFILSEAL